jgi:heme-degrading monooxygenase HmoA
MFTRVISFTGANDIDAGVEFLRDHVVPVLKQQKGFRGVTASADRAGRVLGVLSLWDTASDREASESALAKTREEGERIVGGEMSVETFEELYVDVATPPRVGASLLLRRISMPPEKIDENVEFFKREVVPQIKSTPGYLALRNMINRQTGNGLVGTVWADNAALEAAAKVAEERRSQAAAQRVTFGEQSRREIVFIDLL